MRTIRTMLHAGLIAVLLSIQLHNISPVSAEFPEALAKATFNNSETSWIVKWKGVEHPDFLETSLIFAHNETFGTCVASPAEGENPERWLQRWSTDPGVEYVHQNRKVKLLASPDDEFLGTQNYLKQIRANQAWDVVTESSSIVIAIVDTGIDLEHPDLQDNLIDGVNLIDQGQPPQDDHGHGTNVAGVIAAIGNNNIGTAGLAWKARLMSVKALEADGQGDEAKLAEGIQYAVDNGARIVVLSVGLHRYSPFLEEVSEYAEKKGVLLISATGNEGKAVKYPSAYSSVLAVGGVSPDNKVMLESNYGPEVDIVAPWKVYTTALGGDYEYNQGTSMAAPQVAGVAALIWAKYPAMKLFEVRNLLLQTAQDIEDKGWDPYSGYGLLRADRALKEIYRTDMYEPNDSRQAAKRLPLDTMVFGELTAGTDEDWFYIDPAYDGSIQIAFGFPQPGSAVPGISVTHYTSDQDKGTVYNNAGTEKPVIPVKKGKSRLRIKFSDPRTSAIKVYKLTTAFQIYPDPFEDNDRQYKAYSINASKQVLKGTFHQLNDQDWFSIQVGQSGSLRLSVTPDTVRMDVALMLQRTGEKPMPPVDWSAEGESETLISDVQPGRYYVLVSDVISDNAYPVRGEYALEMDYSPSMIDPNEPNDKYFQATFMTFNTEYTGVIGQSTDIDWFSFALSADSYVKLGLRDIPADRLMLMTLLDNRQVQKQININALEETELAIGQVLPKGTYYVKLGANQSFQHQFYRFDVRAEPLVAGFRDIKGHWAEQNIAKLVNASIVSGYGDFTFRPDRHITRSEAAMLIAKAFRLTGTTNVSFSDVRNDHWAYQSIGMGTKAGILSGYSGNIFRPDQILSRAEMSVMIARALKMDGNAKAAAPFIDVDEHHWAASMLRQLLAEGYIAGYRDGTFRPDGKATRAEMVALLAKALNR